MQNLSTTHREDIAIRNEIAVPVGKETISFIDTRDIGEAASICLMNANKHYDTVTRILTDVLGRPITYPRHWFSYIQKRADYFRGKKRVCECHDVALCYYENGECKKGDR